MSTLVCWTNSTLYHQPPHANWQKFYVILGFNIIVTLPKDICLFVLQQVPKLILGLVCLWYQLAKTKHTGLKTNRFLFVQFPYPEICFLKTVCWSDICSTKNCYNKSATFMNHRNYRTKADDGCFGPSIVLRTHGLKLLRSCCILQTNERNVNYTLFDCQHL